MTKTSQVIIPLIRPQYVPSSELLVSSIVHRHFTNRAKTAGSKGYRFLSQGPAPAVEITGPDTQPERIELAERLTSLGARTLASKEDLANATIDAVTGVSTASGKAIPASPLTPYLALAQDLGGSLNASNPPDIGQALESMYVMGRECPDETSRQSMGELWLKAAEVRLAQDPVLNVIDGALSQLDPLSSFERHDKPSALAAGGWAGRFPNSPFGWLNAHWRSLTSPSWVEALPPRVWTDWSTMVLRTGLAFGYLWEAKWYESIGRALMRTEPITALPTTDKENLLPWPPSRLPVKARNVKGEIRQLVSRGVQVREVLLEGLGRDALPDPVESLEDLRNNPEARIAVREALSSQSTTRSSKNTYETVIYSLQQRSKDAASTDYYGFLRHHGTRYSVVAPGTEWIAVIASLACSGPGGETNVGRLMSSLEQLGLRPELQEIVRALESAGLAEGSADADHGVRVRSAF